MSLIQKMVLPRVSLRRSGETTSLPPVESVVSEVQTAPEELRAKPTDPEEQRWLQRARQGDLAAFDWLISRYRERAVRLASHVLRRSADAEDVVQEAFLRALAQIGEFRGEASFYTWLYRIVVRCCLNRMRTPAWQRDLLAEESDRFEMLVAPASECADTRMLVETLLDRLSPPLRAALALRELEGLDYSEIAETLQVPVGTVRSRLNAARLQFRTLWQAAMEEVQDV